ncbi:MAG: HAD family phosphatase [Nanoarchaeota archaeon]|nr:HAD family phosphatase [Nanoarchaeota archaeon]
MKIKAVIFDKDGVLIDTVKFNIEAAVRTFRESGIELDEDDKKTVIGRHPADFYKILEKKYKFDYEKSRERQRFHYFQLYEKIKLYDGAKELILALKKKELKLALATSSGEKGVNIFFDKFGLKKFFDEVVTFKDCKERKPAPDIYLVTAERLDILPEECLVFEDSPVGVKAAKRAGMKCVAVTYSSSKDELKEADYIISNLNEFKYEWLE